MRSKLRAVSATVLSQRKAVPTGRIMLRRIIIGMMAAVLLSLTGAGVASAQAETQTVVTRTTTVDEKGQFVCTAEGSSQQLTGQIQTVFHVTEDGAGGFTIVSNSNYVNFTGVDEVTGQKYRATGSAFGNQITHLRGEDLPETTTYVTPAHLIGQGPPDPGLTFEFLFLTRFTVFPTGDEEPPEIEVHFELLREECH
jgi:hypothetical protein